MVGITHARHGMVLVLVENSGFLVWWYMHCFLNRGSDKAFLAKGFLTVEKKNTSLWPGFGMTPEVIAESSVETFLLSSYRFKS